MLALGTDLWTSWVREHFEVFFPGGQLVLMVWILVYLDLFLSCHSLWIKEERFAMEIAQSQLELNTLRDNCKLPWLINVNIIWCIISNFMWILPRNLVYVLEDSKRGVLLRVRSWSWSSLTYKFLEKFTHLANNSFWISNFRWKEVAQWVKDKLSITYSLAFSYFDDEGDLIFVSVHFSSDD